LTDEKEQDGGTNVDKENKILFAEDKAAFLNKPLIFAMVTALLHQEVAPDQHPTIKYPCR